MKAGGSGSFAHGPRVASFRNLLIVGETALALVLLVASGLMIQSVRNLQRTELGFVPDELVTADLSLPTRLYDAGRMRRFLVDLQDRVRSLPGVQSVAFSNTSPVSGDRNSTTVWFPDKPSVPPGSEPLIGVHWTSPAYFSTMGIHVLKGRTFTDRDRTGTPRVVVINETAARSLFKSEDPIGRRIAMGFSRSGFGGNDGAEVIGVVNDVRYQSVERAHHAYVSLLSRRRGRLPPARSAPRADDSARWRRSRPACRSSTSRRCARFGTRRGARGSRDLRLSCRARWPRSDSTAWWRRPSSTPRDPGPRARGRSGRIHAGYSAGAAVHDRWNRGRRPAGPGRAAVPGAAALSRQPEQPGDVRAGRGYPSGRVGPGRLHPGAARQPRRSPDESSRGVGVTARQPG